MLKIAAASLNQSPIDWDNNLKNISEACDRASALNAEVLCLPELALCGYSCEDLFFSDWLADKCIEKLLECLPYSKNLMLNIGLPIRYEGKLYNCNAILENGAIKGIVAKQLLANEGVYYEQRWFHPWPPGAKVEIDINGQKYPFGEYLWEYGGKKFAMEICEDAWREDERPGNRYCTQGVDIFLNPSASHFALNKTLDRQKLVRDSSEKFDCIYVYANLSGNDSGRLIFDGEVIIAEKGEIKLRNPLLPFSSVNLMLYEGKKKELPPEESDNRYLFPKAVSLALFDYLRRSAAKGFVLSLSGGADSSACALLVAYMIRRGITELGHKQFMDKLPQINFDSLSKDASAEEICEFLLTCVFQSTDNSSDKTLEAAEYLAKSLGAKFEHWSVQDEVSSYSQKIEQVIARNLSWDQDDISLQNIQARTRSPIIWMLANLKGALLITTSNRSEGDVGYATMDGDTSGSIAPIAGISKTFLLEWLQWAEKSLDFPGLALINQLKPTAELRPPHYDQNDEKDLMPYDLLLKIEVQAIRERKSPLQTFQILKSDFEDLEGLRQYIIRFYQLWSRNQWKRERLAPSFHVDDFNVDPKTWCRFPILSGGFKEEIEELRRLKVES